MAQLILYGTLFAPKLNKILVAANYVGVSLKHEIVDAKQTRAPEFRLKHPLGKIPVVQTPQGYIYESNAILRYIARLRPELGLYGDDPFTASQVDQWLDFSGGEIESHVNALVHPILGYGQPDEARTQKASTDLKESLKAVNQHLTVNSVLVGHRITVADIELACVLLEYFRLIAEEAERNEYPAILRWFKFVTGQTPFQKVIGEVRFCKQRWQPFQPVPGTEAPAKEQPKKADKAEKGGDKAEKPKDAGKDKKAAPEKKEEAKKEKGGEKKKEEPKKGDDDEEEAGAKKEKNPLDALPPSTFDLYNFKTLYVNAPDKHDAMKTFWEKFDPNGYSLWKMQYQKAEGEGKKLYLTENLAGGIVQRLDDFRKYAFGVHGVYGEEPNLEIQGVFVWRGTEHAQEIKDLPNYEYQTITRLDHTKEADRKLVADYWTKLKEGETVDGLKVQSVKYFK